MARSDSSTPQAKQVAFKRAFEMIKSHCEQANYLAAYVVTFSIIEDRVRAIFVIWYRSTKGEEPTQALINRPFSIIVNILLSHQKISAILADQLKTEAKVRNKLFHSAMWNLDLFTGDAVKSAVRIARDVDKVSRAKFHEIRLK
jgi:hypothetical protein